MIWCWFGFHDWNKWQQNIADVDGVKGFVQTRVCKRCKPISMGDFMTWRELLQADAERQAEAHCTWARKSHEHCENDVNYFRQGAQLPNERLLKLIEVLEDLKHLNNHTIDEEMWRIDTALADLRKELEK